MPVGTQSASQPRLMWPVCCLSDFLYTIPQKTLAPRAGIDALVARKAPCDNSLNRRVFYR